MARKKAGAELGWGLGSRQIQRLWVAALVFGAMSNAVAPGQALGGFFDKYFHDEQRRAIAVQPTPAPSLDEGKARLTERQAIELALQYNLGLNVQRHQTLVNEWAIEDLKGVYDPALRFGLNWNRDTTPTASVLAGGPSVTDILTSYDFGFQKAFSTGTTFEASFTGTRVRTTNFFSSLVPAINTNFQVLLRQSLLKGFGRVPADYQIEIARNNLDISEQDFKKSLIETIFSVQDAYWELQFALQDIQVKQKSLELATTIQEQNQARFEVGSAARLQVVEAEAEVASRREELIRAQFYYRSTQDQLVRLISNYRDPRQYPGELVPMDPVAPPGPVTDSFDRLQQVATEQNPDLQRADLELANQKVNLEFSRDRLKPTLDLVLAYQQFGLGGTQVIRDFSQGFLNPPIVQIVPGGLTDSLEQLFGNDFYGYTVGLGFQLPIFNTQARAENAQAQIEFDRLALRKRSLEQDIALEIREALTQVEMNEARQEAAQATVRLAQERLDGEQAKFEVGLGTTREFIEAQRDLVRDQSVLLRARVDLIKSHAQLDRAVGRTLQRQNIRIADALATNVQ